MAADLKNWAISAGIALETLGPGVPAALQATNLPQETKEAAISLVQNAEEAVEEGVKGARDGEDAANAEQYVEPESAEHADPPDGWDVVEQEMFESAPLDTTEPADFAESLESMASAEAPDMGPDVSGGFLG